MGKKYKKNPAVKLMKEIPIIGEFAEALFKFTSPKTAARLSCCCLPVALLLLIPGVLGVLFVANALIGIIPGGLTVESAIEFATHWLNIAGGLLREILELLGLLQWLSG